MTKGSALGLGRPVRVHWRKSSYSGTAGNCVEVAALADGATAVRDSKNPDGPALVCTRGEWEAFTAGVRAGEFR